MKLAIVGSRDYSDLEKVRAFVRKLPKDTVVVSGGAPGVDSAAEDEAHKLGLPEPIIFLVDKTGLPPYPEGRSEFARRAYARNKLIVDAADKVVAFCDGELSGGTKNTCDYAKKVGKPLVVNPFVWME